MSSSPRNELAPSAETLARVIADEGAWSLRNLADLRRWRDRLDGILQVVGDGVLVVELSERVVYANPPAARLLGWDAQEGLGRPILEALQSAIDLASGQPLLTAAESALTTLAATAGAREISLSTPQGTRSAQLRTAPVADAAEALVACVLVLRDTTEQRRIEVELRSALGFRRKLERVSTRISGALTCQDVLAALCDDALAAVEGISAAVWMREGPWLRLARCCGETEQIRALHQRVPLVPQVPAGMAFLESRALWFESWAEYAEAFPLSEQRSRPPRPLAGGFACLPLRSADQTLGVAVFTFGARQRFDEETRAFLAMLMQQGSIAYERARLHEAERRAHARAVALAQLTAQTAAAETEEQIAAALIGSAMGILAASSAGLWIAREGGFELTPVHRLGAEEARSRARVANDDPGPLAECARQGRPRSTRRPERGSPGGDHQTGCALCLPLLSDLRVVAVMELIFEPALELGDDDRQLLDALARQGALAFERIWARQRERTARELAERASRTKDQFLAMLGHELRNPLAPILTAVQLMKLRAPEALVREREIIDRQAQHLVSLVDDLLDVSRISRGKLELKREPLALTTVIGDAVELVSPLLEERRHHLRLAIPVDLWVDGDPRRLSQAFGNLLSNAAKYTDPGGHLRVGAKAEAGWVEVRVEDDGVGIAPGLLPEVFEEFVQGPQSLERSQGGLGLGLSIARNLLRLHQGTIEARSEGTGRGSTFVVRLPLRTAPPAAAAPEVAAPGAPTPGHLVLVVDDNVDGAELLAEGLRLCGCEVLTARDGPSALELIARRQFDVALLDLGLPGMDGYELARRLRQAGFPPESLMAVTGYGQPGDRELTRDGGFGAHLVKPVLLDELVALIRLLPRRGPSAAPDAGQAPRSPPG